MITLFLIIVLEIIFLSVIPIGIGNAETISLLLVIINTIIVTGTIEFGKAAQHRHIICTAYFLKIAIMLISYYDIFPIMFTGADSVRFDQQAFQIWQNPDLLNKKYGTLYQPFLGNLYLIIGPQKMVGQYFNVLLSTLGLVCIDKLLNRLKVEYKAAQIIMLLLSLSPVAIILSSVLMRDALVTNFFTFSFCLFLLYTLDKKIQFVLLSLLFLGLASAFHSGVFPFVICILLYVFTEKGAKSNMAKVMCGVITIVGVFVFWDTLFAKFSGLEKSESEILEQLQDARGGSAYLTNLNSDNIFINLLYSPIKIVYFLFSPMPWNIRHLGDIVMLVLDSTIYYFITLLIIRLRVFLHGRLLVSVTVGVLLVLFAFANGTHNTGTAARHRYKILPAICLIYGLLNSKRATYETAEDFDSDSCV